MIARWLESRWFFPAIMTAAAGVLFLFDGGIWGFSLRTALLLGLAVMALLDLMRRALGWGGPIAAVARAVLAEAVRMKIAVVFIVLLVLVLPLLPAAMGADQPLRYRVQSFLAYSLGLSGFLLSLMTVLLACATLSEEVEQKQIFNTAVKPIARPAFILGKWLGIVCLNLLLTAAAGVTIHLIATQYLARLPAQDMLDRMTLQEEVLTARQAIKPEPVEPLINRVQERLKQLYEKEPGAILEMGRLSAQEQGLGELTQGDLLKLGRQRAQWQLVDQVHTQWLSIGPGKSETYVFPGVKQAKDRKDLVQLRYKMRSSRDVPQDQVPMVLRINKHERRMMMVVGSKQTIQIPPELIGDDGKLELQVINPGAFEDMSVLFMSRDDLQLYYEVGAFGPNLLRAMIVLWLKLAFLAAAGLAAASFAGFPVAALTALVIYLLAWNGSVIMEAFLAANRKATNIAEIYFNDAGYWISSSLSAFSQYDPVQLVVEGRVFTWEQVGGCVFWIGVIWTALALGIGAWIFQKRELARVQV